MEETLTNLYQNGSERVLEYFSKQLGPAEESYSANDMEQLASIYVLERFKSFSEGSEFLVITDNRVLKHYLQKKDLTQREAKWIKLLGQYGIKYITVKVG